MMMSNHHSGESDRRRPDNRGLPWNRRDTCAVLVLIILWALFFWRYFAPDPDDLVALPPGDFSGHFYVLRSHAYDQLRAGRFPLWGGEGVFSVYPFQADPESALFYPPTLGSLLLWLALGWDWFPMNGFLLEAIAHILLASFFSYAFLRRLVRSRSAALLGSLVFAYGGYLVSYPLQQTSFLEAAVWLPLALLQVRLLCDTGRRRHLVLAAAAFTLAFLPGNPQNLVFLVYATLGYYAFLCWRARAPWRQFVGHVLGLGLLTVGLSAVQLLPSVEWWRLSTRASIPFEMAATGLPPQDLVQFVLTGLVSWWQPLYVGILSLVLAFVAGVTSRQRDVPFWVGLVLVALVLSFGKHVFGFEVAYFALPGVGLFRNQERHAYLVVFGLAVLAAYGADVLLSALRRPDRRFVTHLARWLRSALPVAFVFLLLTTFLSRLQLDPGDAGSTPALAAVLFLALAFTTLLLYIRLYQRVSRPVLGVLLLLVLVFDLFSLNRARFYAPVHDPHARSPLMQEVLADPDFFRVQEGQGFPLTGAVAGRRGLRQVWGVAIPLAHYDEFLHHVAEDVRWRLMGVKYVVTSRAGLVTRNGVQLEELASEGNGDDVQILYRLPDAPRPAWIVHEQVVATDREDLYDRLNAPGFDPFTTAVLRETVPLQPGNAADDDVDITGFEPDRITLRARLASAGLLVLGEVTYPGWRVYVDGERAHLHEVYGVLRAVALPAGDSLVEFRFRPITFYAGAALTAFTLLTLLGLVITDWWRKPRCTA